MKLVTKNTSPWLLWSLLGARASTAGPLSDDDRRSR